MIAIDTSSYIAYFAGDISSDTELVDFGFENRTVVMLPPVLAELLSDPALPTQIEKELLNLPMLPLKEGFWLRVAKMRKLLIHKRKKAGLADSLIAQMCLDHNLKLITRDLDFKSFKSFCGLDVYIG